LQYLEAIREYLAAPDDRNRQAVVDAAEETDQVRGGYFSGGTMLSDKVDSLLEGLKNGDKSTWVRFLSSFREDEHDFAIMKNLSPFKGQMIIIVDYGCGFVKLQGDIHPFLDSLIEGKDMRIYDADKYFVTLPFLDATKMQVSWIRCGGSGPMIPTDGPRPATES